MRRRAMGSACRGWDEGGSGGSGDGRGGGCAWIFECAPTTMRFMSPRSTALYQTDEPSPSVTSPMTAAPAHTSASGATFGTLSRYRSNTAPACLSRSVARCLVSSATFAGRSCTRGVVCSPTTIGFTLRRDDRRRACARIPAIAAIPRWAGRLDARCKVGVAGAQG
eukprot:scaffold2740_cov130-Isochrysis_galbana.AAC.5